MECHIKQGDKWREGWGRGRQRIILSPWWDYDLYVFIPGRDGGRQGRRETGTEGGIAMWGGGSHFRGLSWGRCRDEMFWAFKNDVNAHRRFSSQTTTTKRYVTEKNTSDKRVWLFGMGGVLDLMLTRGRHSSSRRRMGMNKATTPFP